MYELYSEILYEILHIAGSDSGFKEGQDALFFHLQQAFNVDNENHIMLLEKTKERKAPNISLNIEVIEAKNLKPSDSNGLSDPFCIIYLTSSTSQRFNTSIKPETLHPVWREAFSLPVTNPSNDVLCLEVWDFDPEETTREKMKKIKEVKGMKGIKILIKEFASSSKQSNDLIGSVLLPLKDIPTTGQTIWCTLDKNGKIKKQGDIKVRLSFGFEKNSKAALQEHRHLLHVMLLYELKISKEDTKKWNGNFCSPAQKLLTQHHVQCGLTSECVTLAQWIEFINVHMLHPLNFDIILSLLQKLVKPLQDGLITDEEETSFWEAMKKLVTTCMINIRKLQIEALDDQPFEQISAILSILSSIGTLQPPKGIDLFPFTLYEWLILKDVENTHDIQSIVVQTVHQGSKDWFEYILDKHNVYESSEEEEKLNKLAAILDIATGCLRRAISFHDKLFQEHFHFPYAKELYISYETLFTELIEPTVTSASSSMKQVKFDDMEETLCDSHSMTIGASLFQLYISLQQFSSVGRSLCLEELDLSLAHHFHHWFYPAALQWLYISYYKALHGIKKAVHLDQLTAVDECTEYSSSAIDTLQIFEQIRIFWKKLAWPDNEAAFTFATNIINDIIDISSFYADKIGEKVERMCESGSLHEQKFDVTKEWCVVVKNIGYIQQSIRTTVAEFGIEEIISSFINSGNSYSGETCKNTIQKMVDDGVCIISKKIKEMLDRAADKMMPTVNRFMMDLNNETSSVDNLMKYLDDTLCVLHSHLSSDNFKHILNRIWRNISRTLKEWMEESIKMNREPSFYKKQHETVIILVDFFKQGDEDIIAANSGLLKSMQHKLLLHGMETCELIHHYYLERRLEQKAMEVAKYGLLTVRMQFAENVLRIEILNARNLVPLNNKNTCNPFVKTFLLPEEEFPGLEKLATKTHKNVVFPLFEEKFTIPLTSQQINNNEGLVMFVVKEKCLVRTDKVLAEGFVSFADITKTEVTTKLDNMEQLHLKLNRPTHAGSEAFEVLKNREDKLAQDFIKKRKQMFPMKEV